MPKMSWDPKVTLGNVLTILMMLLGGIGAYATLKADVQASAVQIRSLQEQIDPLSGYGTRLAVVERNQVTGKEQREAFQVQIALSVDELRKQNLLILTQLAGISARLDERDRKAE